MDWGWTGGGLGVDRGWTGGGLGVDWGWTGGGLGVDCAEILYVINSAFQGFVRRQFAISLPHHRPPKHTAVHAHSVTSFPTTVRRWYGPGTPSRIVLFVTGTSWLLQESPPPSLCRARKRCPHSPPPPPPPPPRPNPPPQAPQIRASWDKGRSAPRALRCRSRTTDTKGEQVPCNTGRGTVRGHALCACPSRRGHCIAQASGRRTCGRRG